MKDDSEFIDDFPFKKSVPLSLPAHLKMGDKGMC